MMNLWELDACTFRTARLICFKCFPVFVALATTTGLPTSPLRGQDALPRVKLSELVHATIAEPGGAGRFNNAINAVSYSSDGSMLAIGMRDPNLILILDPATLAVRERLEGHSALVLSLTFAPDGKSLISGGLDGTARVWDLTTNRQRLLIDKFQRNVMAVAMSRDGNLIYTGEFAIGPKGTVQVWDAKDGQLLGSIKDYEPGIEDLQISPDGLTFATTSRDTTIRLWDLATFEPKARFDAKASYASSLAYTPDGKSLAATFDDASFRLLDAETMRERYHIKTDGKRYLSLSISPDGLFLATADGHRLQIWRLSDGAPLATIADINGQIVRIRFSPDSRSIVAVGLAGFVQVFQVQRDGN